MESPSTVARIRRVDRRHLASRISLASEDDFWRQFQLRFIGIGAFFVLSFGALVVLKLKAWIATHAWALVVGAAVLLGATLVLVRRRRQVLAWAPRDSEDLVAGLEVEAQLQSGALRPDDLVFERGVWTTLLSSRQFYEAAETRQAALTRRATLARAIAILVGTAALIGFGVLIAGSGGFFDWLIRGD